MSPGDAVNIFDFHARLVPGPDGPERLLSTMDSAGIAMAAVSAGGVISLDRLAEQVMVGGHVTGDADNRAVLEDCQRAAGRLVPFYFGNPHTGPAEYRELAEQFHGLEISPAVHGVPLTDGRTTALVEVAAEFGHPVYVVCLAQPGFAAADLVVLADKFPDTTFVLGHCGFVGVDLYSVNVVADRPTIAVETSGCYTVVAASAVRRLGARRVLFGTEYPIQHPDVELAKLRALDLDPTALQQIAWANAYRLLGKENRHDRDDAQPAEPR